MTDATVAAMAVKRANEELSQMSAEARTSLTRLRISDQQRRRLLGGRRRSRTCASTPEPARSRSPSRTSGEGILLRVADDGVGFDSGDGEANRVGHIGIASMIERAELAGGWLRIDQPGTGTVVEAWIPIRRVPGRPGGRRRAAAAVRALWSRGARAGRLVDPDRGCAR